MATPELAEGAARVQHPKLELVWGGTLYHIDDLPFTPSQLPDVYTQFRKVRIYHFLEYLWFKSLFCMELVSQETISSIHTVSCITAENAAIT